MKIESTLLNSFLKSEVTILSGNTLLISLLTRDPCSWIIVSSATQFQIYSFYLSVIPNYIKRELLQSYNQVYNSNTYPSMADLYNILKTQSKYWDRKNFQSQEAYNAALSTSSTVYVGNLSFYTSPDSIRELFSRAGTVKDIIMGIDDEGTPCGFCFVVFENREQAQLAVEYVSKTKLNERIIRVDLDPGYLPGRQKGRGTKGQQRRDEFRSRQDPDRPRKKVNTNYNNAREYRDNRERRDDSRRHDDYRRNDSYKSRDYQRQRKQTRPRDPQY